MGLHFGQLDTAFIEKKNHQKKRQSVYILPCKTESWLLASEMHRKYLEHCLLWLWSAAVVPDRILSISFSQTQTKIQIMANVAAASTL